MALCICAADCWHGRYLQSSTCYIQKYFWGISPLTTHAEKTRMWNDPFVLPTLWDVPAAPQMFFTHVSSVLLSYSNPSGKPNGGALILLRGGRGRVELLATRGGCLGLRDLWVQRPAQMSTLACQGHSWLSDYNGSSSSLVQFLHLQSTDADLLQPAFCPSLNSC